MQDHYATLGISPNATPDLIKTAYRKKAAQFHPDKNASLDAPRAFARLRKLMRCCPMPIVAKPTTISDIAA